MQLGIDADLEEFERRLLILLTDTVEGTFMRNTIDNGLSASHSRRNFISAFPKRPKAVLT